MSTLPKKLQTARRTLANGFTMIEIIIVMALGFILIALGGIFLTNRTVTAQELDRAFYAVRSELARAESDTTTGTDAGGIAIFPHSVTRFQGVTYATRVVARDVLTQFSNSVTITGPSEINFTAPEGVPATTGTITLTDTYRTHTITVNAAGAISIQ